MHNNLVEKIAMGDKEYRVVEYLSPTHLRTSQALDTYIGGAALWSEKVMIGKECGDVQRVALYRYTASKTELVEDWSLPGATDTHRLRHEVGPILTGENGRD